MPSFIYNRFKFNLGLGLVNLSADDIYLALMTSAYDALSSGTSATAHDVHATWTDVSAYEVPNGNGYTTGGMPLLSATYVQDSANDKIVLDGADLVWTTSTISAYGAVLYKNSGSKPLIMWFDFLGLKDSYLSDFKVNVNALGLLNIV